MSPKNSSQASTSTAEAVKAPAAKAAATRRDAGQLAAVHLEYEAAARSAHLRLHQRSGEAYARFTAALLDVHDDLQRCTLAAYRAYMRGCDEARWPNEAMSRLSEAHKNYVEQLDESDPHGRGEAAYRDFVSALHEASKEARRTTTQAATQALDAARSLWDEAALAPPSRRIPAEPDGSSLGDRT